MDEENYLDENFKSQLDAESLLVTHMNRLAIFRDMDKTRYCSSIETLVLMCPRNIREKAFSKLVELGLQRNEYGGITSDKMTVYDDLLVYVCEQLEKHKMIWKKRTMKTYE